MTGVYHMLNKYTLAKWLRQMEPMRHLKLQMPGLRVDLVIERDTLEGWENQGIHVFNKDFREILRSRDFFVLEPK